MRRSFWSWRPRCAWILPWLMHHGGLGVLLVQKTECRVLACCRPSISHTASAGGHVRTWMGVRCTYDALVRARVSIRVDLSHVCTHYLMCVRARVHQSIGCLRIFGASTSVWVRAYIWATGDTGVSNCWRILMMPARVGLPLVTAWHRWPLLATRYDSPAASFFTPLKGTALPATPGGDLLLLSLKSCDFYKPGFQVSLVVPYFGSAV